MMVSLQACESLGVLGSKQVVINNTYDKSIPCAKVPNIQASASDDIRTMRGVLIIRKLKESYCK